MGDDLGTDLARRLFQRARDSGDRNNLGFVYDENCPRDIRILGAYIGFFNGSGRDSEKVHILIYDKSLGERARDSLMWMENYVQPNSVTEGEFKLRVGEKEARVVDIVRVKRGGDGYLEVVLKGKPNNEEIFNALLGCAIAPLMTAIREANKDD